MSLQHPLLAACGVRHGFGTRADAPPPRVLRPRQVHGARAVRAAECGAATPPEADAVVARRGDAAVAVVTADCVPLLAASADGAVVAAIHAGWRGLAAGVVGAGIDALRRESGDPRSRVVAVIGPHVAPCCYEVDAPVLDALRHRFALELDAATRPARAGHWWLDLGRLAHDALIAARVAADDVGRIADACTVCDAERFHSYRRDGPRSGRLFHWIAPRQP